MSEKKNLKDFFNLSFYVRLAVIVVVILLAVFLYHYGMQHTVYVDNRTIEIDGESYRALDWAMVSVDGGDSQEYSPRTRREETVMRQKHTIHVVYEDDDFNEIEFDAEFTLPVNEKQIVLSLPALLAGLDQSQYLTEFVPMAQQLGLSIGGNAAGSQQAEDTDISEADMFGDMTMDF